MPKIVIVKGITQCTECPWVIDGFTATGKVEKYCKNTDELRYIEDHEVLPIWCPLPEDK